MSYPLLRLSILLIPLFVVVSAHPSSAAPTDDDIEQAIVRMQRWLVGEQSENGRWGPAPPTAKEMEGLQQHELAKINGETVLAAYALLSSGWSPQDETLVKALRYLRENDPWGTYGTSVRAHIWAGLPDSYRPNLEADAQWLIKAQKGGRWGYGVVPGTQPDHSTSQYGVLGLWEYGKRGGRVPDKVWQDAVTHFLSQQTDDGGWCYRSKSDANGPTGSMTTAGLTVLYVAIQQLYRDSEVPAPIQQALAKGHAWLDKHYTAEKNPGPNYPNGSRGQDWYYLYGIERVALASGVKTFAGKDWFETGAARILATEKGTGRIGRSIVNTSFALMFLARGRVPVWINKLSLPDGDWNNRPNDIYFFTRYLSEMRENELNWQVVGVDEDVHHWTNAPVAWISSDDRVELAEPHLANLKSYLDLGGLLVANPEGGGRAFSDSIRSLAKTLYPDLQFMPAAAGHPLLTLLRPVGPGGARQVQVLNNGVRDVMILLGQDWGDDLQSGKQMGESDPWLVMANLYGTVTERGKLNNRLDHRLEPRRNRTRKGSIAAARARYVGGVWNVERRAWEPLKNTFFNATGYELELGEVALDQVDQSSAALVHIAGVTPAEFSEAELQALRRYVDKGGTVLVETVGGRGQFSLKFEEQLQQLFETTPVFVAKHDPIITAAGLDRDRRTQPFKVLFRRYSILNTAAENQARLSVFRHGDRPAVIVSHDDLSLGALGVKQWGISGYEPATARELLTTIILTGAKNRKR